MKKIIGILCLSMFTLVSVGQVKFSVPDLTDLQKYQNAELQLNSSYLIQISYAKSLGKPIEDVANFVGDQLKVIWNKETGYDSFVQGILYFMTSLVPYGSVEIIEQTDTGLKYIVTGLYSELKEGGSVFNVTYEEYIKFWEIAISRLGDSMGAKYSQKDTTEGLIGTIKKK